jgi:hypothetical protein
VAKAGNHLRKESEINVISEDDVTPMSDGAERRRQGHKHEGERLPASHPQGTFADGLVDAA